jgi:hypothetical protein
VRYAQRLLILAIQYSVRYGLRAILAYARHFKPEANSISLPEIKSLSLSLSLSLRNRYRANQAAPSPIAQTLNQIAPIYLPNANQSKPQPNGAI